MPVDPTVGAVPDNHDLDRFVQALSAIEVAALDNAARNQVIGERARHLRERLEAGDDLVTLISSEARPRIVELLTANKTTLETAGTELRVAEAQALRTEGLTIESIAELFGVSRQRISALLKQRSVTTV